MTATRWVTAQPGRLVVEDGELPEPDEGQAVIRSVYVGICGSDLHATAGEHPFVPLPYRPGHEVVAVVERLGGDATEGTSAGAATGSGAGVVRPGDRVVVEPPLPCGTCKQCRRGRTNLCENLDFFGCGASQGGLAELSVIRADRLHVLPAELTDEQATFIEPLATPVHAVRVAADTRPGERADLTDRTVVIQGAGTIGLMTLVAARDAGARRIVVTDVTADKRDRALRLGADAVVDALDPELVAKVRAELGESADVVFDCVSIPSTVNAGIEMALKGGTVVVVGVPVADATLPLPVIQDVHVRVQGSITYTAHDYAEAMRILASGVVPTAELLTVVEGLDAVDAAFATARDGGHVKVVVHP